QLRNEPRVAYSAEKPAAGAGSVALRPAQGGADEGEQGLTAVVLPVQDRQREGHDEGQGQEGHEDADLASGPAGPGREPQATAAAVQEREAAAGHAGAEGARQHPAGLLQDRDRQLPRRRLERPLAERRVLV